MTYKLLLTIILVYLTIGCKVVDETVIGTYHVQHFTKSELRLHSDRTFSFDQRYPNPYLHPFDHPDEYYFRTAGSWDRVGRYMLLVGTDKRLHYDEVEYSTRNPVDSTSSTFRFYDEFGDVVPILYVTYSDSTSIAVLHKTMMSFDNNFAERDTLTFTFFGFRPWTYIHGNELNKDFTVLLKPQFLENQLDSIYLKASRSQLKAGKLKFVRKKTGM